MLPLKNILTPATNNYSGSIVLSEQEEREYSLGALSSLELAEFSNLFVDAVDVGLISTDFQIARDGHAKMVLKASSIVGIARCDYKSYSTFIKVQPKIGSRRLLDLVAASNNSPDWTKRVHVDANDVSAVLEWKVKAFCEALSSFVAKNGIRGSHVKRRDTLVGKVKGRLIVSGFINSVARGRPELIPCEFPSFEIDHSYNRIIRWCLKMCKLARNEFGFDVKLEKRIVELERSFSGVSCAPPAKNLLKEGVSLPPNMRHYEEILRLARLLLSDLSFFADAGKNPVGTIAINMNQAYEAAFRNLTTALVPEVVVKPVWSRSLQDASTSRHASKYRIYPDLFLPEAPGKCATILDTKWKRSYAPSDGSDSVLTLGGSLIRPKTSDLFQVTFYALHAREQALAGDCLCVLLYPTTGQMTEVYDDIVSEGMLTRLLVLGWDLSGDLKESVRDVWLRIEHHRDSVSLYRLPLK